MSDGGVESGVDKSSATAAAAASSEDIPSTSAKTLAGASAVNDKNIIRKPLVVKVKKRKKQQQAIVQLQNRKRAVALLSKTRGLPSTVHRNSSTQQQATNNDDNDDDDDDDVFNDDMDDHLASETLCDTFLAMQSLLRGGPAAASAAATSTNTATSVATANNSRSCIDIPLSNNKMIHGILECQLYQHFSSTSSQQNDSIVTQELVDLMRTNQIRKLSAPYSSINSSGNSNNSTSIPPLSLLVVTRHYVTGVQDALEQHQQQQQQQQEASAATSTSNGGNKSTTTIEIAVDWFIRHLVDWTTERISMADFEKQWNNDPPTKLATLNYVLQQLVRIQVLLPCRNVAMESSTGLSSDAAASSYYQLWLPAWALVLKAWDKACRSLQTQIKQSSYKERSLSSLEQVYSPIPTPLVVEWMESMGRVQIMQRPCGKFVRLTTETVT